MKIKFEDLKVNGGKQINGEFNYSSSPVEDALIQKINDVDAKMDLYVVGEEDLNISLDIKYNVDYLDARNLNPLNLNFDFKENVLLTINLQRSEELEIEYFEDEIDLEQLIWELILMNIPFNYSEEKVSNIQSIENLDEITPFANLFNKEEE